MLELLFADDLVTMADSEEQLQERLSNSQEHHQKYDSRMNAKKTGTMNRTGGEEQVNFKNANGE